MPNKSAEPFDWQAFESAMLQQLPSLPKDLPAWNRTQSPSWVSDFMHKLNADNLSEALNAGISSAWMPFARGSSHNYRSFETHRSLIVRIPVPADVTRDQIDTAVSPHQVQVQFAGDKPQVIPLTKPVEPGKASAILRDGILELRMPKSRAADHYIPVRVRE